MKILKEVDFKLLEMKRISMELPHENKPTPSENEIRKQIADFMKTPEDLIRIRQIKTWFGSSISKVTFHAYKTKEQLALIEFKIKKPRKKKKKTENTQPK